MQKVDMKKIFEQRRADDAKAYIEANHLVLNYDYEYNIHLDRIKTTEDILGWVYHLSAKNWMNSTRICRFIELCGIANNKDYTRCG